jgi:hypothetical protein
MPPSGLERYRVSRGRCGKGCLWGSTYLVTTLSRPNMLAHCPAPVWPRYGKFLR